MLQSPLNYTGGKFKLLPQILPYFPREINTFVDLFCGGCNVGLNVSANIHIYNDNCYPLIGLYKLMMQLGKEEFVRRLENVIFQYDLSDVKNHGYEFYGCDSSRGLSQYNRERYFALRDDFNNQRDITNPDYYVKLYALIVYAFNNQIRFNSHGEFNLPPGKRDFNSRMLRKLDSFIDVIQAQEAVFLCENFTEFAIENLGEGDMVYADPPYLITCATYNEQKGWSEIDELNLLALLDDLHRNNVRFALSNVIEAKGETNSILREWFLNRPEYEMIELEYTYENSNYQRKGKNSKTEEVLIINY